jgi:hypothetical protein
MKLKNKFFLLFLFLLSCGPEPNFVIKNTEFRCWGDIPCPSKILVEERMSKMAIKWEKVDVYAWGVWDGWKYIWVEEDQWRFKNADGVTYHQYMETHIRYSAECSPHPKGLCPGIFDWEIGLPLAESVLPYSTEAEKLYFRKDNDLIYAD